MNDQALVDAQETVIFINKHKESTEVTGCTIGSFNDLMSAAFELLLNGYDIMTKKGLDVNFESYMEATSKTMAELYRRRKHEQT